MNLERRHTFIAAFVLALALPGVVVWFERHHITRMQETAALVAHTHEVRTDVNQLLSLMGDLETGARGFVVTGEPVFLEPFDAAVGTANRHLRSLCALTSDNPLQRINCDALAPLVARKITVARAVVDLRRTVGFEAARKAVASGEGKVVMDHIRAVIARMDAEQKTLLGQRSVEAKREAHTVNLVSLVGTGLGFTLLSGMFALVLRENRRSQRTQIELDRFFTLSADIFGIARTNGYFKRVNPAFSQTLGYSTDELVTRPFLDLVHPDDRAATQAEVEKLSLGVPTINFENRYQCQDGSWRWLSWKAQPVAEEGVVYCTGRDITERKRLEAVLTDLQRQRERLLSAIGEGLHGIDRDGNIMFENPAAATMLGWDVHEVIGQPAHSVMHHTRADGSPYPQSECRIYATLRDGVVRRVEDEVFWRKDGTSFPVGYMSTPMRDDAGDIVGALVSFRDVTERNQAEAAIQQLNIELRQRAAQLAEANRELESFSYSVSHDLRAPLRHVQGYIDMLHRATDGQLSEQAQRYLNTIREASVEMGQLIDDLLAFSRMGRTEIKESPVRLDEAVRDTIRGLEMATTGRNIVWQTAPLPAVVGDPSLLKQVLVNLIGNAVKYSRMRDPARIEIGCAGEEDGRIILFVRDNGAGFAMEYAHKLFGVFQRLHRAEEFEGTGIGLATVQRIVTRHGGRVWAEGTVDEGATFYFTLKPSASA